MITRNEWFLLVYHRTSIHWITSRGKRTSFLKLVLTEQVLDMVLIPSLLSQTITVKNRFLVKQQHSFQKSEEKRELKPTHISSPIVNCSITLLVTLSTSRLFSFPVKCEAVNKIKVYLLTKMKSLEKLFPKGIKVHYCTFSNTLLCFLHLRV